MKLYVRISGVLLSVMVINDLFLRHIVLRDKLDQIGLFMFVVGIALCVLHNKKYNCHLCV